MQTLFIWILRGISIRLSNMGLQLPIKIIPSEFCALVFEDANGVTYFWRLDGTYDGYEIGLDDKGQGTDV